MLNINTVLPTDSINQISVVWREKPRSVDNELNSFHRCFTVSTSSLGNIFSLFALSIETTGQLPVKQPDRSLLVPDCSGYKGTFDKLLSAAEDKEEQSHGIKKGTFWDPCAKQRKKRNKTGLWSRSECFFFWMILVFVSWANMNVYSWTNDLNHFYFSCFSRLVLNKVWGVIKSHHILIWDHSLALNARFLMNQRSSQTSKDKLWKMSRCSPVFSSHTCSCETRSLRLYIR